MLSGTNDAGEASAISTAFGQSGALRPHGARYRRQSDDERRDGATRRRHPHAALTHLNFNILKFKIWLDKS